LPIHVPLLLEQGTADTLVSPDTTDSLRSNLCANGVQVQMDAIAGANHGSVMARSWERVKNWAVQRFAGARWSVPDCRAE